ncbi:unnamed protein product (macronuclear) [Paramecium tetraurelia]|uniref:CHY-type domain-containing protein n=1 Tax=Paramecium tetraurelia TaxID=5888 RepID=A0BMW5_PARTE|nr:uncharacterized protein GSPATT00030519001 [Paramecium tetraurelia]CAK59882.1 unnamed protein product [Paramecium tetraurelia]|eukprot:XP_001427280.1 hypothetical protein (macronuclear) [Paramecium tetraurelia strain d4-2]
MKKSTKTQVTNTQKQKVKSPTKKTTEIQQESTLQTGRDWAKQSYRSSQSPSQHSPSGISPTTKRMSSSAVQVPSNVRMQKRHSSIVAKGTEMHQRSVIKYLGLNLEPVCDKKNHEKNKLIYICQNPLCKAQKRLGCAYCLLEEHNNHETMEVQQFCKLFDEKYREFQDQCSSIQKMPERVSEVKQKFEQLIKDILQKLKLIEQGIICAVEGFLFWETKENGLTEQVEQLIKKNIYDMTQDELFDSIEFIQGKHIREITQIATQTNLAVKKRTIQLDLTWQTYFPQLESDIIFALDDNKEMFIQDQDLNLIRLQKIEMKQQRLDGLSQQIKEQIQNNNIVFKQEDDQMANSLPEIKNESNNHFEFMNMDGQPSQYLDESQQKIQEIVTTFPHILYTQDCEHRQPCNTIPIFACCNQAYPCAQCHGYKLHPPKISVPSYRYCMKCLEIYLVIYPTNQAVNCLKCQ